LSRIPVLPVSDRPDVCPGSQFDLGPDHVAGADESVPLVVGVADLLYFKRPARRRTGGGLSVLGQLVAGPAATAIGTACRGCRADLLSPSGPACLADDDEIPMNLEDPLINLDAYCDRIEYIGERHPTVKTLMDLHLAHATRIPFENLDVML